MNQHKLSILLSVGFSGFFLSFLFFDIELYSVVGLSLFVIFSAKLFLELGEKIEIRDPIILIALTQWIIGPLLSYNFVTDDTFYFMILPESEYMEFVLPASLLFIIGLYFPLGRKAINEDEVLRRSKLLLQKYPHIDILFITIGIVASMLEDSMPISIRFVFYLASNIRFVGLFFLVMGNRPYKWAIFGSVVFLFFTATLKDGMFHDLILWSGFFFIVLSFVLKFSTQKKLLILSGLLFSVFIIQTVKHEFRKYLWSAQQINATSTFTNLVTQKLTGQEELMGESNLNAAISRINQGWIIARIMSHVPVMEPFADGETIQKALIASLVPRIIMPDKVKAGGQENYERFTGLVIRDGTSMNLSIIGEAYANYGIWGGSLFMMAVGLFYNFVQLKLFHWMKNSPTLLFWIPFIFLQVVKAEGDFAISLNHIIKSGVVTWGFFYFGPKFFRIEL
jgi:hypothetical protein